MFKKVEKIEPNEKLKDMLDMTESRMSPGIHTAGSWGQFFQNLGIVLRMNAFHLLQFLLLPLSLFLKMAVQILVFGESELPCPKPRWHQTR